MKIKINSNIGQYTLYDTQSQPNPFTKYFKKALEPQIIVTDDNDNLIYDFGNIPSGDVKGIFFISVFFVISFFIIKKIL